MSVDWKHWLERAQTASDDVKMSMVIVGTTVTMLLIIGVWLTWFNNLNVVAGVPDEGQQLANVSGSAGDQGFSLWQSMKDGGAALSRWFGGIFGGPRMYHVDPEQ